MFQRLAALFTARKADRAFDQELETHLSLLADRFARQGMTPEEAAYAARRQFGGITPLKQDLRERRGFPKIETFLRDARHAVRALARTPAFTATAVAALALGIGANVAIFSMVNAVALKPLNVSGAGRIVQFFSGARDRKDRFASLPLFNVWRQQTTLFENISAYRLDVVNLTGGAYPEQIPVARVSLDFFRLFGAPVIKGRAFTAEEDRPGASGVAILSYGLWTRRFGNDPQVIGKQIVLGSEPHVVVGVLGPGFDTEQFDSLPDVFVPFQIDPQVAERGSYCSVAGAMKPDVTLAASNAELASLADEYRGMLAANSPGATFTALPIRDVMIEGVRSSLSLLGAAVICVLLIACANVANLLLARANGRKREIAIRTAVGAGRGRILSQLLTESLVLSLAGGALGLALGRAGIRALLAAYPGNLPRMGEHGSAVTLDWRVLAFTVLVSAVTAILFGIVPALHISRADLSAALKESSGRSATGFRHNRARSLFVVAETALAVVLLLGAALLIRSYSALRSVKPGFEAQHVLTTQVSLASTRFENTPDMAQFVDDGVNRIRALPGVQAASSACCIPLETVWQLPFIVAGRPLTGPFHGFAGWTFISPEYFDVFKIPVLRGRAFTPRDRTGAPGVVIINQAMAQRFWPKGDPLNARLIIGKGMRPEYDTDTERQIVGIVGDVRDQTLQAPPRPALYVPIAQLPTAVNAINLRLLPIAWFVRVRSEAPWIGPAIQRELQQASGGLPASRVRSMGDVEARSTAASQFDMLLMTIFGSAALLLAAIGVYGLMAFSVTQRTQEIGIRLALGARAGSVRNMVVFHGLRLAMAGVGIGVAVALALARFLAGLLFGVKPWDPGAFMAVPLILASVAALAAWIPARRATRIDPATALRWE